MLSGWIKDYYYNIFVISILFFIVFILEVNLYPRLSENERKKKLAEYEKFKEMLGCAEKDLTTDEETH